MTVNWVQFQGGFIGVIPDNGLSLIVRRLDSGTDAGAYQVRFSAIEGRGVYWEPETAKRAAIALGIKVLEESLVILKAST